MATKLCICKLPEHPGLTCHEVIMAVYNKYIDKVKVYDTRQSLKTKQKGRV